MKRQIQAELLDSLPADHPEALHNRRDLRIVNAIMGNHRWIQRRLASLARPGEPVLELGAGTGELGVRLHRAGFAVDGLDVWPRPVEWPAARAWHQADLRTFGRYDRYPVVVANLILHQFPAAELTALGRTLRRSARLILANEPVRSRRSQAIFAALAPLLGAGRVSRHDAHVSIAAGFQGGELADALGLHGAEWQIRRQHTFLGAHRLVAVRRDGAKVETADDADGRR